MVRKQVSADVNKKVQRKEFTCHFADLHRLLFSIELEKEFAELVGIPVHLLVEQHYHVLTEIVMALNSHILKVIVGERFPSIDIRLLQDHLVKCSKLSVPCPKSCGESIPREMVNTFYCSLCH